MAVEDEYSAGQSMDTMIAQRFMGWTYHQGNWYAGEPTEENYRGYIRRFRPSTHMDDALKVMQQGEPNGGKRWYFTCEAVVAAGWLVRVFDEYVYATTHGKKSNVIEVHGYSLPLTICAAALKAIDGADDALSSL